MGGHDHRYRAMPEGQAGLLTVAPSLACPFVRDHGSYRLAAARLKGVSGIRVTENRLSSKGH